MNEEELLKLVKGLNLPKGEYYILASGSLLLYGLREKANDLDLCVSNERLKKFREVAKGKFENDTIDVLKISDFNTTGLVGIEERRNSDWYGLIRSSGNSTKGGISGGSYGSGKHAAFVFSYFRTIFYGTYVEKEGYAFQGKSILCAHKRNNIVRSNIGYWGEIGEYECKPIRNMEKMDEFFKRKETGTDLYIIGAKIEKEDWVYSILYSVIENFWKLIIEDKLEVKISNKNEEIVIDSKNIRQYAEEGKKINERIDEDIKFNAYKFIELNDSVEEVRYGTICTEDDVELKIAKMSEYPEKKILKMRNNEMKINIFSPRKRPVNFIGIFIARGEEINRQLRESEPQTHDDWRADNIENQKDRNTIKETIKKVERWINEQIDSLVYRDDVNEFDAEGLDFLNIEEDDNNGIEEIQKPFDEIDIIEEEEQEILISKTKNRNDGIDKSSNENPNIGGEERGEYERERGEGKKVKGEGENLSGNGEVYHQINMKYIKTPYNSEKNNYRVIIRTVEDIENAEIHFQRLTDSGDLERIRIHRVYKLGNELEAFGNVIKGVTLKADEDTMLEVEFENKRKCIMEVKIYVQD
ncbi:MAG: hypothetical protein Q4G05_01485 [Clostridia bacterium]|nr:hypothetical protein [Clostridia bacterium]